MKILILLLMALSARSQFVELSFPKDLKRYKFENVYESTKLKSPLSTWRRTEIDKKYKECVNKGAALLNNNKVLIGWIFNIWASCVFKDSSEKFDQKNILAFFENFKTHNSKVLNGPWRNSTIQLTQKIILLTINEVDKDYQKKTSKLRTRLIALLESDDVYQNSEIQKWYLTQVDSKQPTFSLVGRSRSATKPSEAKEVPAKKIQTLDEFVNGDVNRSLVQIEPILDSMKSSYRKMEYRKLADMAPKLEVLYRNSELYRDYSMIMGRTFQFLGEYTRSIDYFKIVLDLYPESGDFEEALFRTGLVNLRIGDMTTAMRNFERLVHLNRDKYDITGRYWWLRTLQYNKDPREWDEKNKFANDFPFSYFGLKISAELNDGKLKPIKGGDMPSIKWSLTGKNAEVWERFVKLSEAGWILEAQSEMQNFSWPQNPLKVFYLSMILSKANLHPLSVRSVTPLLESYSEVRSLDAIKDIYPKSYLNLILKEKDRYPLHEHLILSLIRQESSFGLKALSTSNAAGLMQMIQPTALEVADKLKMKIEFPEDLYRPQVNIPMGVFYIHQVIKEMNFHVPLGLAGYNAGPHKIKQFINQRDVTKKIAEGTTDSGFPGLDELWIDELPWAETTGYVKSILRNTLIYELIDKGEFQYRPDFWRDFILK